MIYKNIVIIYSIYTKIVYFMSIKRHLLYYLSVIKSYKNNGRAFFKGVCNCVLNFKTRFIIA